MKSSGWGFVIVGTVIALVAWWTFGKTPESSTPVAAVPVEFVCGAVNPHPANVMYRAPFNSWGEEVSIPDPAEVGCAVRPYFDPSVHGQFKMQCKASYISNWVDVDAYGNATNCKTFRLSGKNGAFDVPFRFIADGG